MSHTTAVDADGIEGKGLRKGTIGLWGATSTGLSSAAPVYSLAATIALVGAAVGFKAPACMLIAFIPMLFTAFAYRELNNTVPDCGTVFTWGSKSFGPHWGWMGGWAIAVNAVVFLGSAAAIIGAYFFALIRQDTLAQNTWAVAGVGSLFIIIMAYVAYRGIEGSIRIQAVVVVLQYVAIAMLIVAGLYAIYVSQEPGTTKFSLSWLLPTDLSFSSFMAGTLLCLFIYAGWDAILALNEETRNPKKTPGRAAVLATVILLGGYMLVTISTMGYCGIGSTGCGVNSTVSQTDIFQAMSMPLLGPWGTSFVLLVTLLSTISAAQSTILPAARVTLSMSIYKALPKRFAKVSPKFMTPSYATFITCAVGLAFYLGMSAISTNVLADTVSAISLTIAFYYSLTCFSCVWYFRKELFISSRNFFVVFLMPLIGGLMLAFAFVASLVQYYNPTYGQTSIGGIGGVFVIGAGAFALGIVLMFVWQLRQPTFFKGETLKHDTPIIETEKVNAG